MSGALRTSIVDEEKRRKLSTYLWFVGCPSTLRGPFTHEQLLKSLATGEFEPGDYCWRQGFQEWRAICTVDEFEFEKKPYVVKSYPEVPVPGAKTKSVTAPLRPSSEYARELLRKTSSNYFDQISEPKTVKVRLERRNRFEMGLWERTGMIIFGIVLAWASTWIALSEVENAFESRFEKWNVGQGAELGADPAYLQENVWTFQQLEPLLSAKGLFENPQTAWKVESSLQHPIADPTVSLKSDSMAWSLASEHMLDWAAPLKGDKKFEYEADPIYLQTYRVYGTWNPSNPAFLRVRTLGYPGL